MAMVFHLAELFLAITLADQSPRLVRVVPPSSPWNAVIGNTVLATAQVDTSGDITSVQVLQGVTPFTAEAVKAISQWQFESARFEGRAVASEISVLIMFRPHAFGNFGVGGPSLGFTTPEIPKGDHPVLPVSVFDPTWPIRPFLYAGVVVFELEIGEDGLIDGIRVVRNVPATSDYAKEIIKDWKFVSAVVHGKPVRSATIVAISFVPPVINDP